MWGNSLQGWPVISVTARRKVSLQISRRGSRIFRVPPSAWERGMHSVASRALLLAHLTWFPAEEEG
jgi:hypothetical protein